MKKFYVGTTFSGQKTVYAYTVAEAAYKAKAMLPDYDDVTFVDKYDARDNKYVSPHRVLRSRRRNDGRRI